MSEWAVTIATEQIHRLSAAEWIWNAAAAVVGDRIWIRGRNLDEQLKHELVTLTDEPILHIDDGRLIPVDRRVPVGRLPETEWRPLQDLISLSLPVARVPSGRIQRTELMLRRMGPERSAVLQILDWNCWRAWVKSAEEDRLQPLQFVAVAAGNLHPQSDMSSDWLAIVRGKPLPGLPGRLFWRNEYVARPLGYDIHPPLDAASLLSLLAAESETEFADYILLPVTDESRTRFTVTAIARDDWLAARREHVEATDDGIRTLT